MRLLPAALALVVLSALPVRAQSPSPRAEQWWADIKAIADDKTEGRQTGSKGYDLAANYVIGRFKALGLAPAGENGEPALVSRDDVYTDLRELIRDLKRNQWKLFWKE